MTRPADKPKRRDAQRNRGKILAAAHAAFGQDPQASLEGIAKDAGVGIGTLYRHFPTRAHLLEAAHRDRMTRICEQADGLLRAHAPDVALRRFLDLFVEEVTTNTGLSSALRAMVDAEGPASISRSNALVQEAVGPLVRAGIEAGTLRPDFTEEDFITLKGAVAKVGPARARRLATLLLEGVLTDPG